MNSPDEQIADGGRRGFEALAVILLSLATVGMAWCSYQASGWSTVSTKVSIQSASRGRDASTFRIKANQMFILDVFLFSEHLKAHNASNEPLARMYAQKFGPELKQAYDVWMRTNPGENPDAPPTPFATNLYQPTLVSRADTAEAESERLWYRAGAAAETSHQYTLVSVLLATALFFAGTAPRFETQRKRRFVLVIGLVALLIAGGMFLNLPSANEGWFKSPDIPPEFINGR